MRSYFTDGDTPAITIDADTIVSRSKARRRPRQFAVGTVGVLAAASLVFAGVNTFPPANDLTSAGIMAEDSSSRAENDSEAGAAESLLAPNTFADTETCGAIIPSQAASPYGLTLEVDLPGPIRSSGSAFGSVRLTNTSDFAVTGTTATVPDLNLTRDEVSISHSPDAQILSVTPVNLQPGQSLEFAISLDIYDCTTSDTGGMLEPGIYTVSTSLAFVPDDPADGAAAEVRSSAATVVLE
ncbi:hypothetical protein ADILRU_1756 [Leifsonia rubra CMS 76R]|nr:hypothetical protein ADILRU_1756 [Leifsonia rubra CMS 76R]